MKRKAMVIIAACFALIVLAQAAFATEVAYSKQYKAVKAAREAVIEKYGLTHATLGMFDENVHSGGPDETTFIFTPFPPFLDPMAVGVYQAVIQKNKVAAVTWTHDGADLGDLSKGHLDMPVWGQAQLQNALDIYKLLNRAALAKDGRATFTEADQAALEKLMDEAHYPEESRPENNTPRPQDFDESFAIYLAGKAILQKYGVNPQAAEGYELHVLYNRNPGDGGAYYSVYWGPEHDVSEFMVGLHTPSGKIEYCSWTTPENITLPEGPLDDYPEAVMEFMQSPKAVLRLSHEERAEIWERINQIEPRRSLPIQYVAPGDGDISEEEAIEAARKALQKKYGFTEASESLFAKTVTFQLLGDTPCWVVIYTPELKTYLYDYKDKMGDYVAVIRGSEQSAALAYWSNDVSYKPIIFTPDGVKELTSWTDSVYKASLSFSETDWGGALYWDAGMLPFVKALDDQRHALQQKNGHNFAEWPQEDKNAHDQPCRDAGFAPDQYPMGLPGPDDILEADALSLAKRAFLSEYGLSEEDLEQFNLFMDFFVTNPAKPVWAFSLFAKDHPITEDTYYLELDSATGEIIQSWHAAMGHG